MLALALQHVHVIAAPGFVEPDLEAAPQRREIRNHQCYAERKHPEAENRQESDQAAGHQQKAEQRTYDRRDHGGSGSAVCAGCSPRSYS